MMTRNKSASLSLRSNRFIPYPSHYNTAFAFCSILYPLSQGRSLRFACLDVLRRDVGLTSFRKS